MSDNLAQEPAPESIFYPTGEAEELSDEQAEEESVIEPGEELEEDASSELEESNDEETEEQPDSDDEQESYEYVEIDGREITLGQIKEWEQAGLRQSDYTQKTQAVAEERKALKAEREANDKLKESLQTQAAQLQVLLGEDEDINWDELREDDPEEYIRLSEIKQKRSKALADIQGAESGPTQEHMQKEQQKLIAVYPDWVGEDGKFTDAFSADQKLVEAYVKDKGWKMEELELGAGHRSYVTLIDAARMHNEKAKGSALSKKVRKAPVMTKPKKAAAKQKPKDPVSVFYGTK